MNSAEDSVLGGLGFSSEPRDSPRGSGLGDWGPLKFSLHLCPQGPVLSVGGQPLTPSSFSPSFLRQEACLGPRFAGAFPRPRPDVDLWGHGSPVCAGQHPLTGSVTFPNRHASGARAAASVPLSPLSPAQQQWPLSSRLPGMRAHGPAHQVLAVHTVYVLAVHTVYESDSKQVSFVNRESWVVALALKHHNQLSWWPLKFV